MSRGLLRLLTLSLRREKLSTAIAIVSVALGVGTVLFFAALGLGLTHLVRDRLFPRDASQITVALPRVAVSFLGAATLDEDQVQQLLRLPGVRAAYRQMIVRAPVSSRFSGDFFGSPLRVAIELSVVGVDEGLVTGEIARDRFQEPPPGDPMPVALATRLVDLYNSAFAPTRGLPQLSPALLSGFRFPMELNRSLLSAQSIAGPSIPLTAQIAGFSPHVPLASVAIPLSAARRLNAQLGLDSRSYSAVTLTAASPDVLPALAEQVKALGLRVDDAEQSLARSVGLAVLLVSALLGVLGLCVCVLAALNIAYARAAAVQARQHELAVMRAVGASQGEIRALILLHAALLGVAGSALGAGSAWLLAHILDALALQAFPPLTAVGPGSLFVWPWAICLGAPALGLLGALLGAWIPSVRASRVDPVRVLASNG